MPVEYKHQKYDGSKPQSLEVVTAALRGIYDPGFDPQSYFTNLLRGKTADSFPGSRISIVRRLREQTKNLGVEGTVLDLGSGPQSCTDQYIQAYGKPVWRFVTVDFIDFSPKDLLRFNTRNVHHTQARGEELPFRDESFSGVISNLALDVMERASIDEIKRVLKPGGFLIINCNNPNGFMTVDTRKLIKRKDQSKTETDRYNYWSYLTTNKLLFSERNEIEGELEARGFEIQGDVLIGERDSDKWWEINAIKSREEEDGNSRI